MSAQASLQLPDIPGKAEGSSACPSTSGLQMHIHPHISFVSALTPFLVCPPLSINLKPVYLCSECTSKKSGICDLILWQGGSIFNTEVKLVQKFFFNRKIFNVKYCLLKEIFRSINLFQMNRTRNVFSIFQNPANYFQKH